MKNKTITKIILSFIFISGFYLLFMHFIFDTEINTALIIQSIINGVIVALILNFYDKIKINKKIEFIIVLIFIYLIFVMLKTHFLKSLTVRHYWWLESLFIVMLIVIPIFDLSMRLKNKKIVTNKELSMNKKRFSMLASYIAVFFLSCNPFQNILPKLFAWIEVAVGIIALILVWKIWPLFKIEENNC